MLLAPRALAQFAATYTAKGRLIYIEGPLSAKSQPLAA
jgi:hypothetical protein